jgi:hypothetical protein
MLSEVRTLRALALAFHKQSATAGGGSTVTAVLGHLSIAYNAAADAIEAEWKAKNAALTGEK